MTVLNKTIQSSLTEKQIKTVRNKIMYNMVADYEKDINYFVFLSEVNGAKLPTIVSWIKFSDDTYQVSILDPAKSGTVTNKAGVSGFITFPFLINAKDATNIPQSLKDYFKDAYDLSNMITLDLADIFAGGLILAFDKENGQYGFFVNEAPYFFTNTYGDAFPPEMRTEDPILFVYVDGKVLYKTREPNNNLEDKN